METSCISTETLVVRSDRDIVAAMDDTITTIDSNTLTNRLPLNGITQNINLLFTCYYASFTCIEKMVLMMGASHVLVKIHKKIRYDSYVFNPAESESTYRNT